VNNLLTIETISSISDAVIKFATPDFYRLTQNERTSRNFKGKLTFIERRSHKNNLKEYVRIWDEFAHELEKIIDNSNKEVLAALGIDENKWENSNAQYISESNADLLTLHAQLPLKLKYC
jgi:hypothetical protein